MKDERASFDQGSLLCEFDLGDVDGQMFEGWSSSTHLCGKDKYDGSIMIQGERLAKVVFDIVGPEKSNKIITYFEST